MNKIPGLEPRDDYPYRVLPVGVYQCSENELKAAFVDRFEASRTRAGIWEGLLRYRARIAEFGIGVTQWIDGSFVEGKPNPSDVDVVSFCDYEAFNRVVGSIGEGKLEFMGSGEATKSEFWTHSFLVLSCSRTHPYHETFEKSRSYWRRWFGRTRPIVGPIGSPLIGHQKGFIQMPIGVDAPVINSD